MTKAVEKNELQYSTIIQVADVFKTILPLRSLFGVFDLGESLEFVIPHDEVLTRDPKRSLKGGRK